MASSTATKPARRQELSFLEGGGKLAELIREFDWQATGLGDIGSWSQVLKTTVNIMLQSPVPIVVLWGKDGIMIYNDAYAVFAGQRHPRLLGSKVVEGWPEVADFNRNVMRHGLQGKTLSYRDQQLTLFRNNVSEEVWMDLNYSPIMDERGKPAGVMAIVVETTQRVLAEQKQAHAETALKAEREHIYDLFMHAPAIVAVMKGPEHILEMANPAYKQIVGQRPIIGKSLREALPELEGQGIYELYDQAFQTGEPTYGNEVPANLDKTGDGTLSECFFNFVYQPYFNDEGEVEGVLVHAVEVTDQVIARKEIEDQNKILSLVAHAQAESEERFRFLAETLPLKIFTADADGKITYFNPQWEEYTGVPTDTLIEQRVLQFIHPDDLDASMANWYESLKTGAPVQNEQRLRRHDGQYRRHISMARAMRDESGAITGWFGSMTDIEDVLQAVVEKEKLEIVAEGLKEQRRQLLAVNKVKDEFVALSSHQLRTPATAVKQYVAMVLDGFFGDITSDQREALQTAYDSNERQLNIINDLLKTAQLDATTYRFTKTTVSIVELLEKTIADMQSALALKEQKVRLLGKEQDTKLSIDRDEIQLVFVNLLENAVKYSYPKSTITVSLRRDSGFLKITFKDQGVGIKPTDIKRIFDKFSRIDNELSDTVNGSGLGLYWAKRIIKLHRGTIDVTSIVGKGSSFTVCLPLGKHDN